MGRFVARGRGELLQADDKEKAKRKVRKQLQWQNKQSPKTEMTSSRDRVEDYIVCECRARGGRKRKREREQEIRKRADSHWRGFVPPCLIAASSAFLPLDHIQCRGNGGNYGISVLAIVILLFFSCSC